MTFRLAVLLAVPCLLSAVTITINPGDNIQAAVNANGIGTTFLLKAGYHRIPSVILPKDNDVFNGEAGTIVSGAQVLSAFVSGGGTWHIGGQTQQGPGGGPGCLAGYDGCVPPEELFIDGVKLLHVGLLSEIGAGKWFFDYAADTIYIADNPAGHLVETSVIDRAFAPGGNGVTINGMTIQMFANAGGGAYGGWGGVTTGSNWVIQNCFITNIHGWGIYGNDGLIFRRNKVTHIGQLGIGAPGSTGVLWEDNEIGFGNDAHFEYGGAFGEAGAAKFTYTTNMIARGNYVHDNIGPGLWLDGSNFNWVFEGNRAINNIDGGLMDEISYDGVIRYNVVENTVGGAGFWHAGGIYVQASPNVEIYGNYVKDNVSGIGGQDSQARGSSYLGPFIVNNMYVHDNVVVFSSVNTGNVAGLASNLGSTWTSQNNRFQNNSYVLVAGPAYQWSSGDQMSYAQWQAAGQDTTGHLYAGGTNLVGTNYNTGDTVTLTGTTTVRQLPFTASTAVATLGTGTGATISDVRGPIIAGGLTWWQANFVGGARGWVPSTSITAGTITVTMPAVTTTAATGVTTTGATSGGNVTTDGGATTTRGLCYATTAAPTTPCTSNGTGVGVFTSALSGLTSGTIYHYRAFASNSAGTSYGAELTFTTGSIAPPTSRGAPVLTGRVTRSGSVAFLGGGAGGAAAPMAIVARGSMRQNSGTTTITSSAMNCTGANLVVVITQSITSMVSVVDNANSGYSIAGESVEPSGNRITIAYMQNAAPSAALSVTATFGGGVFFTRIMAWCISGASTTAALDGAMVGAYGTTAPGTTAAITPSSAGGIILAGIANDDGNTCVFGAGTGFALAFGPNGTLGGVDGHDTDAIEQLGGVGAQTPTITMSGTGGAWRMAAAAFKPGGGGPLASVLGTDVYTKHEHFAMDYSKSVGQEATWTGMSLDPIHYPTDPRLSFIPSEESVLAIRNFGGHKYMYITDQFSGYVAYYRFVGEIAVPAGVIMGKGTFGSWVGGIIPTGSAFMWRDTNGDGNIQSGEIVNIRSPDASIWGWSVGTDGQVLAVSETNTIFTYAMSGIDGFGNPIYVDAVAATAPAPFTKLARIRYLTASDTMYLTGWTTDNPYFGSGVGTVGREIIRYDNWSTGNRTPHMRATLPYNPSFACLDDNTQTCPQYMKAFDVAGSRVVAGYLQTSQYADGHPMQDLLVFDADTGAQLGAILPGATVHNNEGWIDGAENLKMFQRPGGEYVIFREEVVWAKVLVYRMDPSPTITYRTSWLGNSLPGGQDGTAGGTWIPNFIEGMFVLADGTVFSNSAWDEAGGEAMLFKNGAVTQPFFAQAHFHGGKAAAVFGSAYYLSYSGGNPASNHGVRRYGVDGSLFVTSAVLNTTAFITGLTADGTSVYASDPANNRVVILDATTLAQTGTFSFANPGRLVLASGSLWIVDTGTNKIRHFSTAGSFLGQEITDAGIPTALAIDNQGRLMVGDSGTRQQVLFYSPLSGTPTQVATFGISGGIYSGSSGLVAPTKLISPTGVGMDTAGNIYVSSSLAGSDLRAFNTSGALSWWLQGLEFVDVAVADPL